MDGFDTDKKHTWVRGLQLTGGGIPARWIYDVRTTKDPLNAHHEELSYPTLLEACEYYRDHSTARSVTADDQTCYGSEPSRVVGHIVESGHNNPAEHLPSNGQTSVIGDSTSHPLTPHTDNIKRF